VTAPTATPVAILLLLLAGLAAARALRAAEHWREAPHGRPPFAGTVAHYRRCYDRRGFLILGGVALAAFVMAHSGLDEAIDRAQSRVRGPRSVRPSASCAGSGGGLVPGEPSRCSTAGVATTPCCAGDAASAMVVGLPALWSLQFAGAPPAHRPAGRRPLAPSTTTTRRRATRVAAVPGSPRPHPERARLGALAAELGPGWGRLNDRKHYAARWLRRPRRQCVGADQDPPRFPAVALNIPLHRP
jgi:hypothetical protein